MGEWAGQNWRSTYTQLLREFYKKEEYRKGSWRGGACGLREVFINRNSNHMSCAYGKS